MIADNAADIRKALDAIQSARARAKVEAAQREAKAEAELGAAKATKAQTDGDEQYFRGFFLSDDGDIRPTQ
jgi:vacuolar-type H+-ATPase subunit E/Vma4